MAHTHPPATVTWTTFRKLPELYDQESCILAGDVAVVEDYAGIAATEDRVRPFAEALGKCSAVLLPNHGAITTGPNIQLAMARMMLLEGMCARNISVAVAAQATGLNAQAIKMEHALAARKELAKIPFLQPLWERLADAIAADGSRSVCAPTEAGGGVTAFRVSRPPHLLQDGGPAESLRRPDISADRRSAQQSAIRWRHKQIPWERWSSACSNMSPKRADPRW